MVNRKIILATYRKGPEAVISLFEETFSKLEKRIQELENASKKTLQIVINHLIVKLVASWATKDILLV
ncbi:hypothetical protein CBR58_24690 [Bacillus thuringiensis]|nr:hypothetical protein [Bacillus thuringiensis]AMR88283.1 hypothetical protein A3L20_30190 [Bacillus thuringiensis]MBG9636047.1 hypothetical protein [Bacillus thuringiensis]MBG9675907.1 hypothetical protein [Bacillus thuringiensis]MED2262961.1 hypothetical protein [Bacillus thuringiensis]MED2908213.1 hypothetical protein [Bacillus thuringiensis]